MEPRIDEDEISLVDIYETLRKSKKLIITLALIGGLLGGGLTILLKPRLYESSCLMRLGVVLDRPIEPMDRLIEVLKEPNTLIEIAKKVALDIQKQDIIEKLEKRLFYTNRAGLLQVRARVENPKEAVRYVNVVTQFVLERHDVMFQRYKDLYKTQLNEILNLYKTNPLNVDARTLPLITEPTEIVVTPFEPFLPLKRGAARNTGVGVMVGLLIGLLIVFVRKAVTKI